MRFRFWLFWLCIGIIGMAPCLTGQSTGSGSISQRDSRAPLGSKKNPVRVSSGVVAGLLIRHEMPVYPEYKSEDRVGGAQVMRAMISPKGKVERLEWLYGPQIFRKPAMYAVKRWRYKPYLLNGVPVWVETIITINL